MKADDLIFEQYRLVRELGRGGMGTVWLGMQRVAGVERPVGIKTLSVELAAEAENVEAFLNEARIVTLLNHPNIVSVLHGGAWAGEQFIVMEYVDGETLARLMRGHAQLGQPLPLRFCLHVARDVALALFHAHSAIDQYQRPLRLVHRDVSPQNIMVRLDGLTKLLDFGIARVATRTTRTETGVLKGKLRYLSPEQLLGQQMDGRSDQFALGVVLWELVTNQRYIENEELHAVWARLNEPSVPPSVHNPALPAALDAVVSRMLNRLPDDRYPSCREVALALTQLLDGLPEDESAAPHQLVERLAGEQIRARTQTSKRPVALPTSTVNNQVQCPTCRTFTAATSRFCPTCGRPIARATTSSRLEHSTAVLVLIDVVLTVPAAVGPRLVSRALQAMSQLAREAGAFVIGTRPLGLTLVLGLPLPANDDLQRALLLAERLGGAVRLVDPGMVSGAVITTGPGVVAGLETGAPLVMGPILESAERHRAELRAGRVVVQASAAKALDRPLRPVSADLVEVVKAVRETRTLLTLSDAGREEALGRTLDWVGSTAAGEKSRVKVWEHTSGDGATSVLKLLAGRLPTVRARARLYQLSGLDRSQPFGLVRRIIDDALVTGPGERANALSKVGLTASELELTLKALTHQPVDRPDVLPQVVGLALLKVLTRHPAVLLVDDAQLSDPASLRVLNHLSRVLTAPSAALLVASAAALEPLALASREKVPGLAAADFQRIWLARTSTQLDLPSAELLWAQGGRRIGPVVRLADEALKAGVLKQVGDHHAVVGSLDGCAPAEDSLETRLARLTDDARKYLERAVVLGERFSHAWVKLTLGLTSDEAIAEELIQQGLLNAQGSQFADAETLAALTHVLPGVALKRARIELAFTAHDALPDPLAAVVEEARLFAEAEHPNAVRSGLAAANQLEAVGAPLEALEALCRVLRRVRATSSTEPTAAFVASSLMRVALTCAADRGLTEVRPVLEADFEAAARAGVVSWVVKGLLVALKPDEAAALAERALQVDRLEVEVRARLLGSLAQVSLSRGRPADARAGLLEAFHTMNARPAQEPSFYWEHLNLLGRAAIDLDDVAAAQQAFHSALEQASRVGSDAGRARASTNLAGVALRDQRIDEALTWLSRARTLAEASLDRQELARVELNLANVLVQLQKIGEALEEAKAALAHATFAGWAEGVGLANALVRRLGGSQ